jgi:TPR repeat protein
MTITRRKTRSILHVLAGAATAASISVAAFAAEPAPNTSDEIARQRAARLEALLNANATVLADVPVVGRRSRASDAVLRLSTTRASSCAFDPRNDMSSYMEAMEHNGFGRSSVYGSPSPYYSSSSFGMGYDRYAFSEFSPFGNASTGLYRSFRGYTADGCGLADYGFAAGRAHIARKDKTVAAGFAAYEAGDYATAYEMFRKADHKLGGSTNALMLARVLIERAGDPADAVEAVRYLKYASGAPYTPRPLKPRWVRFDPKDPYGQISSSAEAAAILGKMHFVGYGVPADAEAAVRWFKVAVQQGHIPAAKIAGDIYFNGYGVERDVKEAERYYRVAAEFGYAPAKVALGDLYYYGDLTGSPDVAMALTWYASAAQTNDPGALYALAHAYDAGEGVPRDAEKALGYYKLAALGGDARARGAIGDYFYRGEIVERDPAVAREWFAAAAVGGEADAMFNLAAMMAKGEGGETDRARAWALMKAADARGHPTADEGLTALEAKMSPAEREAGQALLTARN